MLYPDLVDIPIEVFGGYTPAIPPQDLPSGASPFCQDVEFPEGCVRTRGGLFNYFSSSPVPANAAINGLKTYSEPTLAKVLLAWDSLGNLYQENPQGTLTIIAARPQASQLLYQSTTLFGREYQGFYNSSGGADIPRQFDATYWDRVSQDGPGAAPTAADSATAGNILAGKHQVSVAFITRQGFITMAAVSPGSWTAAGSKQVTVSNIATGPSYVVARLLLFTPVITSPATTGSFYSLPTGTPQLATPTVMLINDNMTASVTVDFNDTVLQAGFQANYLFSQLTLGESAHVFGYNSRLGWLGERNKQPNFVNLGFDGGYGNAPSGNNQGPNSPASAIDDGLLGNAWANPTNVFALDGIFASVSLNPGTSSDGLIVTNYGFSIPSNATISGIVVSASVKASVSGTISDGSVLIVKGGTPLIGSFRGNGNLWGTSVGAQVYGSSSDLWNTTWAPADINANNFGIKYGAHNSKVTGLAQTGFVDYISIKVFYTVPGAATVPLGWTPGASSTGASSALFNALPVDWGDALSITGDGATAVRGQITQSAYQDYLQQPIIARNISYRVRARIASAGVLTQGTVHINLQSTLGGFTTSGLAIQASQLTTNFQEFDALLTAAIVSPPTDLVLQVYADGTPTNGGSFIVDSIEPYPANTPFNYSTARFSHAFNPESYDATTGQVQVRPNDGQQLRAGFPLRADFYLAKDHYLCKVTDDGVNEPASWTVEEVSSSIGICGPNAVDWTEEWAVFAERSGLYICWGSDPVKLTPEIQEDASQTGKIVWNSINWAAGHTVWVRIDKVNKRILVGAPVNGATSPNVVFALDYKWLDTAQDIASSQMVVYSSFTGKILAHGRGRRWTYWNISANSMTFAERTDGTAQPFFGNGAGNGKIYQQLPAVTQSSDDGAPVNSRWDSYYAPSHVEEQGFRMTALRKLLGYITLRAVGAGQLSRNVQANNRTTVLRSYTLSTVPAGDAGIATSIHGERFSIQISTNAVGAWFQLEHLIPFVKKSATIPVRGVSA